MVLLANSGIEKSTPPWRLSERIQSESLQFCSVIARARWVENNRKLRSVVCFIPAIIHLAVPKKVDSSRGYSIVNEYTDNRRSGFRQWIHDLGKKHRSFEWLLHPDRWEFGPFYCFTIHMNKIKKNLMSYNRCKTVLAIQMMSKSE